MKYEMASMQDHYSLRWNNHQNHILRAFDTLLQTKTLVDVTLVCAETSIRAHKMVLSACSPFFQRVFAETPCKHPVIVLKDFRGWVVQAIVDFMYRGEISVPQERLQTLILAGESLQVRGLVESSVPDTTPTPAASPDEFGMMDTSLLSSELGRFSSFDDESPSMVAKNSKILLPSSIFSSANAEANNDGQLQHPELCTSPMPRRKQARPRRRSGECPPDANKSFSPTPLDDESEAKECDEQDDEMIGNDNEKDESDLKSTDGDDIKNVEEHERCDSADIPENKNTEGPENLCTKKDKDETLNEDNCQNNNNNNNTNKNNNRIVLSLKDIRHLNKPPAAARNPHPFQPHQHLNNARENQNLKQNLLDNHSDADGQFHGMDQMDLSMAAAAAAAQHHHHQAQLNAAASNLLGHMSNPALHQSQLGHDRMEEAMNRMSKELRDFPPSSPSSLPSHFNPPDAPPHPPSPLPFPGMSSALTLTPPHHMFGLDSPLGLFPHGLDPSKLYNPLMEMSDPRGLPGDHPPFLKKKIPRPKGQHSAPRGGPPRSWTNAELTEALQHVWNKKMTTSQASRIFGIPYNSLLMYVRGKYGKSLKLEQLRKDCISGPPVELLQMGGMNNSGPSSSGGGNSSSNKNSNESNRTKDMRDMDMGPMTAQRSSSSEPDLMSNPNSIFNPFPPGFYPDFSGGFPGLSLGMLNLLPPDRHQPAGMHMNMEEDCKSDRSKQSMEDDFPQPLALNHRDDRREVLQHNGQD